MPTTSAPKATIGTVSHGTLHPRDLIEAFSNELARLTPNSKLDIVKKSRAVMTLIDANWPLDDIMPNYVSSLVNNLTDILGEFAPPYCYFGAHEGDGSDFGFWPHMDLIDELWHVSDPSEVKKHRGEDVVFVNDHGNVTLYNEDGSVAWEIV